QLDCACAESDEREARSITKSPEPLAVGAHQEDALLRRLDRSISKRRRDGLLAHLEDDAGGVWQDPPALGRETPERPRPIPGGGVQPTSPGGVRYWGGAAQFHHRDRIAVPAPHDELLLRGGPPLRVGGALGHHIGEGPDARARGGAGAPLGAGPPAVAAPPTACRACPLALRPVRPTRAVARCRGPS